jgi:hypothetical protein
MRQVCHSYPSFSQVLRPPSLDISIYIPVRFVGFKFVPCYSHSEHGASMKRFVSLQFLNIRHLVGSASRKATTYTGQHKHRKNSNIHTLSEIRTHEPRVRASEDQVATVIGNCVYVFNNSTYQSKPHLYKRCSYPVQILSKQFLSYLAWHPRDTEVTLHHIKNNAHASSRFLQTITLFHAELCRAVCRFQTPHISPHHYLTFHSYTSQVSLLYAMSQSLFHI